MNNFNTTSEYDEFRKKINQDILDFINENGYTWTVEDVYKEYTEKYCKNCYISYTSNKIIEKFKDDLAKVTGITK